MRSIAIESGLPLNFAMNFLPERVLLSRLLAFAAVGGSGTKEAISVETDIPTGHSTGKVEPMIGYAQAMGLVVAERSTKVWRLTATELGQRIALGDPYLTEPQTQWLLHLLLCRRRDLDEPLMGIADAWFALFAEGVVRLGRSFLVEDYLQFLQERHGDKSYLKGLAAMVIRSYFEPNALAAVAPLHAEKRESKRWLVRNSAPTDRSYFPIYAAWLGLVWDQLYPQRQQIGLDELASTSGLSALLDWSEGQIARWLDWMVDRGWIAVDRQTGTALLLRLRPTAVLVAAIYSELV